MPDIQEFAELNRRVREYGHHIEGTEVASSANKSIERSNPATGAAIAKWPAGTVADVDRAVRAAVNAFDDGRWSGLTGSQRSDVLRKVADRLKSDPGQLAFIETLETGKPLGQAREEIPWAGDVWDYAAGQARSLHGDSHGNLGPDKLSIVIREPVGPVALITPWNYPLLTLSLKLPFALAAGCTVVIKPSELSSGTTLALVKILEESGLPPGVCNVVTGYGDPVGKRLAEHPDIRLLSFTGSTATGRSILAAAAGNMKKVVLELGGKNPNIVFADADLEAAVDGVIKGFVYNAGAECCSGSRVLVQQSIAAKFTELLCHTLGRIKTGDPMDPNTTMGAIVSQTQFNKIRHYIEEGKKVATLAYGGRILDHPHGFFVEPTVFKDVPQTAAIAREEIFGPVIAMTTFVETEDAAKLANDTDYGLAAALWTTNLDTAIATARRIKAGVVWINTLLDIPAEIPVGGVRHSGYGRENGRYAIEEYTVLKTIVLQSGATPRYVRGIGS